MSHFTVMVAVPGNVTREKIEEAVTDRLQPFHEFECTGIGDQYVQEVDVTDDARASYNRYVERVKAGDEKVDQGQVLTKPQTFEEFARDYYGFEEGGDTTYGRIEGSGDNIRVIDRTNPNKKWDWWVIGGRWSGLFLPERPPSDPNAPAFLQRLPQEGNIIRKSDWPYRERIAEARDRWNARYDAMHAVIDPLMDSFQSWETLRDATKDIDEARKQYNEQPLIKAAQDVDDPFATAEQKADKFDRGKLLGFFDSIDDYLLPRDQFLASKAWAAVGTYAMVDLDGHWLEKGEMGWWGISVNEKDDWAQIALDTLDSFPEDTWLVAVDCHI